MRIRIYSLLFIMTVFAANVFAQNWVVYDADVLPESATPAWAEASISSTDYSWTLMDDPNIASNKYLEFISLATGGVVYQSPSHASAPTLITAVIRARHLAETGSDRVCEIDLQFALRDQLRIESDEISLQRSSVGIGIDDLPGWDPAEWNTYRVTLNATTGAVNVYLNEMDTAILSGTTATATGNNVVRFGDGASGNAYAALIDYVAYDTTGTYSPYERPLPYADLDGVQVGYVTQVQTDLAAETAPQANDAVVQLLKDEGFDVTVHLITADSLVDLSDYDVAIGQERFGSTSAIWKSTGTLGLASIPVPFIWNKAFALRDGRGFTGGATGTGAEVLNEPDLVVDPSKQGHDLFKGLVFTDNKLTLVDTTVTDAGGGGTGATKSLQYGNSVVLSNTETLLGIQEGAPGTATVGVNDIPSGTTIGSETTQARMITIPMNSGTFFKANGTNLTNSGLTLWRNAVYSLAGLTVPEIPVGGPQEGPGTIVMVASPTLGTPADSAKVAQDSLFTKELMSAGYTVWHVPPVTPTTASQGYLDTLNNANLIIAARSTNSGFFDGDDAPVWNGLTTPMMAFSPFAASGGRLGWSSTTTRQNITTSESYELNAKILLPGDDAFSGVTVPGDSIIPWFTGAYSIMGATTDSNGEILAADSLGNPLYIRWSPGVEFYTASGTSPAGHRTYMGLGNDNAGLANYFQFTAESKSVWLAEVARMVAGDTIEVENPGDKNVIFITDDEADNEQITFLEDQGLDVTVFWPGGTLETAGADTIEMLNNADLIIIGRSAGSGTFGGDATGARKDAWNALTAPIISNNQFGSRNSRINWFNSALAPHWNDGPDPWNAHVELTDDPIFEFATLTADDSVDMFIPPHDFIALADTVVTNGTIVAQGVCASNEYTGRVPAIVRFDAGVPFYPDTTDAPAGPRTYFGFGNDNTGPQNYFPLTDNAKHIYWAEISRMLGLEITEAVIQVLSSESRLASITVDGAALVGFDMDVTSYDFTTTSTTVPVIAATAVDANANVVITPASAIGEAATIVVTAEDGFTISTYTINIVNGNLIRRKLAFFGNGATPTPGDAALIDLIEAIDLSVADEVIDEIAVTYIGASQIATIDEAAEMEEFDGLFVSESIGSSAATPMKASGFPVRTIIGDGFTARGDKLGFADGENDVTQGNIANVNSIEVIDAGNNLFSDVDVPGNGIVQWSNNAAANTVFVTPSPSISTRDLATLPGAPDQLAIFFMDEGEELRVASTGTAADQGSGILLLSDVLVLPFHENGFDPTVAGGGLTTAGEDIFKRSIMWVLNINVVPPTAAPGELVKGINVYPNPSTESVTMTFNIPSPTNVTAKLFDLSGREVATFLNNKFFDKKGEAAVELDLSHLKAGTYIYELMIGDDVSSGKLIVK